MTGEGVRGDIVSIRGAPGVQYSEPLYKTKNTIKTETDALAKLSGTIHVCMSSIGVIPSLLLEKLAREMQPVGWGGGIVCICKLM